MNYLGKFLPSIAEVCEPLQKLTSSKCKWTWSSTYQNLADKVKKHHQEECDHGFLQWKTAAILRDRFTRSWSKGKSSVIEGWNVVPKELNSQKCNTVANSICKQKLTVTETLYSNKVWEVLCILHNLENFHQYHFTHKVSMITDHKLPVAIFKKDVVSLSHRPDRIRSRIHQYNIRILHKPGPELFITDWLSRHNHVTNRDEEISGMCITINARVMHRHTRLHDRRRNKNSNAR